MLSTGKLRGFPGIVPPFQKNPKYLSPLPRNLISLYCLDCHPEYLVTPRWHVCQPCGKASRESHRSLCQLDGKPDTAATAQEESGRACLHSRRGLLVCADSRGTPRSMSALERKPQVPASAPDEDLGPSTDWRGIPRGPSQLTWKLAFPEATRAGP